MKFYEDEFKTFKEKESKQYPVLDKEQARLIQKHVEDFRKWGLEHPIFHFFLKILPIITCITLWFFLFFYLPILEISKTTFLFIFSILYGTLSYSFVVYTLHECAGHQSFRTYPLLKKIMFNLSRLKMADPEYYKSCHSSHHNHLGTMKDCAFTNYIAFPRFFKSILPGAGIIFPNDYNIHQNPIRNKSRVITEIIGFLFLSLEFYLLSQFLGIWESITILVFVGPWIGMALDRIRETTEHRLMPSNNKYGATEWGLNPLGLLLGGGPWGQPCHFSHHFAPDLAWYQQIRLHLKFRSILREDQKEIYFMSKEKILSFVK